MSSDNSRKPPTPSGPPADNELIFSEAAPSDPTLVDPLVERALAAMHRCGCGEHQREAVEMALREALANAILHGNQSDPKKTVQVECYRQADGSVLAVVRDQGGGFDLTQLKDPTQLENLLQTGGRGLYLIRHCMDDVEFSRGGCEIRMRKKP